MFKVTIYITALDEAEDFCKSSMENNDRTFISGSGWVTFVFYREEDAVALSTRFTDRIYSPNTFAASTLGGNWSTTTSTPYSGTIGGLGGYAGAGGSGGAIGNSTIGVTTAVYPIQGHTR